MAPKSLAMAAAGAAGRNGGFLLAGTYDFYHDAVRKHGRDRALAIYHATLQEMQRIARAAPGTVRAVGSRRIAADAWELGDCRAHGRGKIVVRNPFCNLPEGASI